MNYVVILTLTLGLALPTALPAAQAARGAAKTTAPAATGSEENGEESKDLFSPATFSNLKLRSLGPALMSGRVGDLAVDPANPARYFVAVASGGVWKTENAGTTYEPVFDSQASYSIGCVTIDPNNPHVIWVGTGENNSQRSVSWGDGVYKSLDGGKTWKNMGLKRSEHIGMIRVDPRNSNVVYVAAQGPLWGPGGDRGLYKTSDGGASWERILHISENTGVSEVHFDPRNPDVLYASAYQRRRHVWTLINGGPESGIYKSTDAGKSWRKLTQGLPKVDLGRIGLAVSPANPDVIYAIVEAMHDKGGIFRSRDRGESWERRSGYLSSSGQYYSELFADPKNVDRVYSMDTYFMVSEDGGKTWARAGEQAKHVDNHALWIDPNNTDHLLIGSDGGIYESWDRAKTWQFKPNLPITQFYRVAVGNDAPFYTVCGGTQDNNTQCGPARTTSRHGITNSDWFITQGGDGFVAAIDPENPNIIYSEAQYGWLVRYDRASGERVFLQPQEAPGDDPHRWNWDSPFLISPHNPRRLYFAAQRVFRSEDRGDSWVPISGDLTRQIDRNRLKVMDRVWPADAVAKNASTSFYGNITALDESPLVEGLLYVGTDDGLIQVSENSGGSWRKIERFPGVPELTYVSSVLASRHDPNTVYATFDNHQRSDFSPYVLKSRDRGRTWIALTGNLKEPEVAYDIAEDHADPNLLFLGTEYGVHFSPDGGGTWIKLKGMPTISVRDIAIQRQENDLVLATFGRGFYVLDDYTPLRGITRAMLEKEALLFPVKDALAYLESGRFGWGKKASLGETFYTADNPPFGATFTYYLKDSLKTKTELRHEREKEAFQKKLDPPYPTLEELREEELEEKPQVILTVRDAQGEVVRHLAGPTGKGFQRVAWNLRYPAVTPPTAQRPRDDDDEEDNSGGGPMVVPGEYTVTLAKRVAGVTTQLAGPIAFQVKPLNLATLPAPNRAELLAFQKEVAGLQRRVLGAVEVTKEIDRRLEAVAKALRETPAAPLELTNQLAQLRRRHEANKQALLGDRVGEKRNYPIPPSITARVQTVVSAFWSNTSAPTGTARESFRIASEQFAAVHSQLKQLVEVDLKELEKAMEQAGAPWTPGRL